MKMMPLASLALGLTLACVARAGGAGENTSPQQTAVAPPAAAADSAGDPNRKVCKYVVQTGSRMGRKVCHTQAYWDEMELAAKSQMREIDSQAIQQKSN